MKNKKFGLLIAGSLFVSMFAVSSGAVGVAVTEDEQWPSQSAAVAGLHVFELDEVAGLRNNISVLTNTDSSGSMKLCTNATLSPCNTSTGYSFRAVLGPCTTAVTIDCIEAVTATPSTGSPVTGVFKQFFPAVGMNDFVGSASDSVPNGGPPSLWTLAGLPHVAGSDYEVTVEIAGRKVNGDAKKSPRSFFASITPVNIFQTSCNVEFQGTCMDTYKEQTTNGKTDVRLSGVAADQDEGIRCVNWGEDSKCALKRTFPDGAKFTIKVRLSTTPGGWLHGRMKDPTASIVTADGVTTVSVTAEPTKVPIVSGAALYTALPTEIKTWFDTNIRTCCGTRLGFGTSSEDRNAISTPTAYSETAFTQLKLWTTFLNDKAAALPTQWSVRTLSDSEMSSAPKCIKEGVGVTGIVATNASAYGQGPPSFDDATKTLNYKVAAPHYEKNGTTEFKGRYALILRSDIAKCRYNLTDATATASVAVVAEDNSSKTATISTSNTDGWFKFSASGFTHSAPTIKVKLVQQEVTTTTTASTTTSSTTVTIPVVTTTLPSVTVTTPSSNSSFISAPSNPKVKVGKTTTVTSALRAIGASIPSGAKVVVTKSTSSVKKCSVTQNKTIKGLSKGNCKLTVSITPKATKAIPHPKTTKKSVTVIIS